MYEIFERLCEQRGVTAYRVAKETGVSTSSLTNWKKGRYVLKADKMKKIADYFGVSVDYLMGNEDVQNSGQDGYYTNPETAKIAQILHDHPEFSVMFDAYSSLDPKDAQLILDMIERMSRNGR